MGPIRRETEQRMQRSTEASIDRADNRATVVFAIGVMLATILLLVCVFAGLVTALTITTTRFTGVHISPSSGLFLFLSVLIGPLAICNILDRLFGARLPRGGTLHHILETTFRLSTRAGLGHGSEVLKLLTSHGGTLRTTALITVTFLVVILGSLVGSNTLRDPQSIGNYALFPHTTSSSLRAINAASYDDQRNPNGNKVVPYVQSSVIEGPYLRLVVPWRPAIDNPAVLRSCPQISAMPDADARTLATLDCMQKLHAVILDGKPLDDLRYDVGSDPRAERPALEAMIDVRALTPGRHELRVMHAPGDKQDHGKIGQYIIPFWR